MALNVKIEHAVNQLKRKNGMLTVPCCHPPPSKDLRDGLLPS